MRKNLIMLTALLLVTLSMPSCASKLLKQAPKLAVEDRFFAFEEKVGQISHNRCEKLNGKKRKCTKKYYDIKDLWNVFYPGHIIISKQKVFK